MNPSGPEARAVGYVVGEVQTDGFTFVTNPDLAPPRLEYIVLRGVRERTGDSVRAVEVLAQVTRLSINNRLLSQSMNYNEVEAILRRLGATAPIVVGQAKVLGYLDPQTRSVRLPRGAAMPGALVETAPDALLRRFFGKGVESGLEIGALINRPQVEVRLDPNGMRRHMAVIAQTGAGKSYTVGVLLEQLLGLGGTVLVFDPNSDYVLMGRSPQRTPTPFAERVSVYRVPSDHPSRIADADIGAVQRLSVRFASLDADEVCEVAGISEKAANIRLAVRQAWQSLQGKDYTAEELYAAIEALAGFGGAGAEGASTDPFADLFEERRAALDAEEAASAESPKGADAPAPPPAGDDPDAWFGAPEARAEAQARAARERARGVAGGAPGGPGGRPPTPDAIAGAQKADKYIEYLRHLRIWGFEDLPLDALLAPMRLSAIDLAGVDRKIADFVVAKIVGDIWRRATREGLARPVFLVLEEAHNFVPAGGDEGRAGYWLKRIASEGRKFGIFLVLVTQRPYRVHQDTLSQCGSQIIMRLTNPEDQNAIRRASESISEGLLADLPGLNVGEAVILGNLVRVPVMVRIRERQSDEGGSDIDLVKALEAARAEAETGRYVARREADRAGRSRAAWREEI